MDCLRPMPDNLEYYENVPPQELQKLSINAGLETCPDLEMIHPLIDNAKKILEIGGGYGRTIDFLIKNNFKGLVDIIEPTDNFHAFLQNKYPHQFNIFKELIQDFTPPSQYDLILWLWSNVVEFSPLMLKKIFKKLCLALEKNGVLVIETMREHIDPVGLEYKTAKTSLTRLQHGTLKSFNYTKNNIITLAQKSGLKILEIQDYALSSGRLRTLMLLTQAHTPI